MIPPLSLPEPWDTVAEGYADVTMDSLTPYAKEALRRVPVAPGSRVLDVACGPGTLALLAATQAAHVDAVDFSPAMIERLRERLEKDKIQNVHAQQADGQALPFDNNRFDVAYSMFGVIFFPNRAKGFSEIFRTLKSGGCAAISSWAPVDRSPEMKTLIAAMRVMDPDITPPKPSLTSLENPGVFQKEMEAAGFQDVKVESVTAAFAVPSIPIFWNDMVRGSVPFVLIKEKIGDALWKEREPAALKTLASLIPVVPTELTSDAWIATGRKP